MKSWPYLFVSVLLLAGPVTAADEVANLEPLVTDRPTDSVSPIVVPKGSFQVETGYRYSQLNSDTDGNSVQTFPDLLFRYGLGERFEARLLASGWNARDVNDKTETNVADISIGTKIELIPTSGNWSISGLLVDVSMPTGSAAESNDYVIPKILYVGGYNVSDSWALTYNAGPSLVTFNEGAGRDTRWNLNYAVALSTMLSSNVGLFAEVYGAVQEGSAGDVADFQVGTTLGIAPQVQIDFRVGAGLASASPDWFAGAGLAFRLQ